MRWPNLSRNGWLATLTALSLVLASFLFVSADEPKKEDSAVDALKQKMKKYDEDLVKLRDALIKECDDELKKTEEVLKKAQKEMAEAKKDPQAYLKAASAMRQATMEKMKLQQIRSDIAYRVHIPSPPVPPKKPILSEEQRLGLHPTPPSAALVKQLGLEKGRGLILEFLDPNSAAGKAGLKQYDILVKIDGKSVPSHRTEFKKLLSEIKPDTAFDVVVIRGGKQETIKGVKIPDQPGDTPKKTGITLKSTYPQPTDKGVKPADKKPTDTAKPSDKAPEKDKKPTTEKPPEKDKTSEKDKKPTDK